MGGTDVLIREAARQAKYGDQITLSSSIRTTAVAIKFVLLSFVWITLIAPPEASALQYKFQVIEDGQKR